MTHPMEQVRSAAANTLAAAAAACCAIPPAWPLAATVAVNPYLGQTGETLAEAGARLARAAGVPVTMPRAWYAAKIARGEITDDDLAAALRANPSASFSVEALKAAAAQPAPAPQPLPTVADIATATGSDWPGIVADRIGLWASGYFDDGQALWSAPRGKGAWRSWKAFASHDITPEILGLAGFGSAVEDAPDSAADAIVEAVSRLGVSGGALQLYFHRLLMTLGGWGQLARYRQWTAELAGQSDETLLECLAIRLFWDAALFGHHKTAVADAWAKARADYAGPPRPSQEDIAGMVLQEAAERAAQREMAASLAGPAAPGATDRPELQAVFCIDVRSEVFRRALEAVHPEIETLGFAGFFGLGVSHRGFGSDVEELRLPVLLTPGLHSHTACGQGSSASDQPARITARAARAWGRFKLAAVSSFAFVESAAPVYAGKLLRDGLGFLAGETPGGPPPCLDAGFGLEAQTAAAESVLRAMSLTANFARLVLFAGHGANVVNNPHASALHCGACGGYSGEVNARLLAGLLNDPEVRAGLKPRGIDIPADTLFIGALHDTTTDAVTIYDGDFDTSRHTADLKRVRGWLAEAGKLCRGERATRLPRARGEGDIAERSRNWAEVRPEWALAGCKAFIAAPRSRTAGRAFDGRVFLHSYDWRADTGWGILELIITAPVVVASWISLQYYGSTVSPEVFGAGNKLLHNVTGGVGVFEGNGGLLRAGLPWQSVHDGEKLVHEPLRLTVCIEAPRDAITDILRRHDGVRALFDNRWLHLIALDDTGRMAWRYAGGLAWEEFAGGETSAAPRPA